MRKLLLPIVALLLGCLTAFGQISLSVGSKIELIPEDADATSYYRQTDINDNVCAIIKVVPENSLANTLVLQTKGGMAPVAPPRGESNFRQGSGEWWFWVSPKVTNIMFTCEGYTPTDWLGVSLQPGKVYRLKLNVDSSFTMVKTFSGSGLIGMQMTIKPEVARVAYGTSRDQMINFKEVKDGIFDAFIAEGKYYFRVESKFYETWASEITVKKGMKEINVSLTPAYGTLKLNTVPEGAEVFLDGELIGTTPIQKSDMISGGDHMLLFRKTNYYVANQKITVKSDGSLQTITPVTLKPQFGNVTLLCDDPQADLIITDPSGNEVFRGKSGSKTSLNSQLTYKLESSRKSHLPQSRGIVGSAIEGQSVEIVVEAPVPIFGELQISSTPSRAEVWIDGVREGVTIFSKTVLIGEHQVELRKEGYDPLAFTVDIQRDQTTQLSKDMPALGSTKPRQATLEYTYSTDEYVDLGLSVKWASCNVGADEPEDNGHYYAWGAKFGQNIYDWEHYTFRSSGTKDDDIKFSKYVLSDRYGSVDLKKTLDEADDVARFMLGRGWRMPTAAELTELKNKCTWTWGTYNGVKGYDVQGPNGNRIFLPAAGYNGGGESGQEGEFGYYWDSHLNDNTIYGGFLYFNENGVTDATSTSRYYGLSVRAVYVGASGGSSSSKRSSSAVVGNTLSRREWRSQMKQTFDNPAWTYDNGKYRGQLNSGRNGYGAYWWKDDDDMFFGYYSGGDREGMGIYLIGLEGRNVRYCDGCMYYVGNYSKNIKQGKGTCYDKFGNLIYYGDFKDDKPVDDYPMTDKYKAYKFECIEYDNGNKYVGETKDGKRHGRGIFLWKDGSSWYGRWEDGSRSGRGVYFPYTGSQTVGSWKADEFTAD